MSRGDHGEEKNRTVQMSTASRIRRMDLSPKSARSAFCDATRGAGAACPGRRVRMNEANRTQGRAWVYGAWSMNPALRSVP